jgi:hypothetical protein
MVLEFLVFDVGRPEVRLEVPEVRLLGKLFRRYPTELGAVR